MLQLRTDKKTAWTRTVLVISLLLITVLWPQRLIREKIEHAAPAKVLEMTEVLDRKHDAGGMLRPAYSHLLSLSMWFSAPEKGTSCDVRLFGQREDGSMTVLAEEKVDLAAAAARGQLPGYIDIPMDVDLDTSAIYTLVVYAPKARFSMGIRQPGMADTTEEEAEEPFLAAFYNDTNIEGRIPAAGAVYSVPLGRGKTLAGIALIAAAALLVRYLGRRRYDWHPEKNTQITLLRILQVTLTPVICMLWAAAVIMIWPMRLFDRRALDIAFYLAGVTILAALSLWILQHRRLEGEERIPIEFLKRHWRHYVISLMAALVFHYCCRYMNGLYNMQHYLAERRMLIAFFLMLLATFRVAELAAALACPWVPASAAVVFLWFLRHRLPADAPEAADQNTLLALTCWICVLAILFVTALIRSRRGRLFRRLPGKPDKGGARAAQPARAYMLTASFLGLLLVIFRNTRTWPVILVCICACFYARYMIWDERHMWLRDLTRGILWQFGAMVLYSLMHRYYLAFLYTRFALDFHTVTVTAVYLTVIMCAASSALLGRMRLAEGMSARRALAMVWPELIVFGVAGAYLIMTMSRTGAAAAAATVLFVLILGMRGRRRKLSGALVRIAAMLLATVIMFPPVFTAQRLVSTVVGQPHLYEIESYPDEVMRGHRWDSMYFMCVERFLQVAGNKYLGLPEGDYDFNHEWDWLKEEKSAADAAAASESADAAAYGADAVRMSLAGALTGPRGALASTADFSGEDEEEYHEHENSVEDYTNGRMDIYRAYLRQLNWGGHDVMGAVLDNGEIAVHAHNAFLQAAFDHGIFTGAVFLLFIVFTAIRACVYYNKTDERKDPYSVLPFAAVCGFAVTGLVEWVFQLCNPMTALLVLAAAPLMEKED